MPVSIRDVATRANVSVGTVSKALNDAPSRIPAATREHIRRVAAEIGYQPNRLARSLGRRRTDTIGLMISGLRNPFFVELAEAAEALLLDAGYQVLLDAAPSRHGTYVRHAKLRGWPVDGVLMWAATSEHLSDYLGAAGADLPVVYLGYLRPDDPASDAVAYDLYDGGRRMTEHLIDRGHGARGAGLLHIAPSDDAHERGNDRARAFLDVCAARGVPARVIGLPDFEETREAGYALGERVAALPAAERPGGVFCHNDVVAVGFYRAVRRAGLRVPEDIAVAGFDANPEARYLDHPLTTVATPPPPLCRAAVGLLLERISGVVPRGEGRQILLPVTLEIGGTT